LCFWVHMHEQCLYCHFVLQCSQQDPIKVSIFWIQILALPIRSLAKNLYELSIGVYRRISAAVVEHPNSGLKRVTTRSRWVFGSIVRVIECACVTGELCTLELDDDSRSFDVFYCESSSCVGCMNEPLIRDHPFSLARFYMIR
jgi:hypothetical protein